MNMRWRNMITRSVSVSFVLWLFIRSVYLKHLTYFIHYLSFFIDIYKMVAANNLPYKRTNIYFFLCSLLFIRCGYQGSDWNLMGSATPIASLELSCHPKIMVRNSWYIHWFPKSSEIKKSSLFGRWRMKDVN